MRRFLLLPLVVVAGLTAGSAFALDCAALKGTDIPFALTLEVTTRQAGEAPTTRTQQIQVFRKGPEVTTYTVDSPTIYLRTRGPDPFFPLHSFYSSQADDPRTWTYSVDPAASHPAAGKPLRYSADMKGADGKLRMAATMTFEYVEAGTRQLGGCTFVVAKLRRTLEGLADRQPVSNSSEVWFAPALRTVIASTLRTGNVEVTSTATAIWLEFNRVE